MRVVFLYSDGQQEWNCSRWRCHLLSNAVEAAHEANPKGFPHRAAMWLLPTTLAIHHPAVQSKIGIADVLIFQRNVITEDVWTAMDYWRALGKIVCVDLDDHYPNIPASNPAYLYWTANGLELDPPSIERLKIGLRDHADALIAPSQVILDDWKDTVPGYFWPNYPSRLDYEKLLRRQPGDPDIIYDYKMAEGQPPEFVMAERKDSAGNIYIGWGGSISHVDSFFYSNVVPALDRLMRENPKVHLKLGGHDSRLDFMFKDLPKEQVIRQRGVDPDRWPSVISSFDIGIAPLDLRECESVVGTVTGKSYDERRSWLKLVEYLCAGVPFVATDCAPYKELGRFGKLVPNTVEAWYDALKSRVDGLPYFYAEAMENRKYAMKKLTIEANAENLIRLYTRIGEETQVRRLGAKLPEVLYIERETKVA